MVRRLLIAGTDRAKGGTLVTRIAAIRKFFSENSRPVTIEEMKRLTKEDKDELGPLCLAALGETEDKE